MGESQNLLMTEFLSWVATRRRTYDEAMAAWQSHCPRATIWEDAITDGLIELQSGGHGHDADVVLTARGKSFLARLDGR
ncbi:MAG: hypothetical protein FJ145_05515 [Deltaproteobacteria bacterium]|nr:hypothetical protein [Deltaproteobacteria bacterium]